ncbi:GDP dissociation inhibitor-domain-containing protein [Collybia nuda]|uniref:GDP dissociation inhibitor-domain-containing protein n=1 Tax=Collybia nuda TaxID=64659 RepID=A0A9P5XRA0_9AGAR|nr:GDP dissociation inhibitor-domain-containing protein [Collybia nuda]
MEEGAFDVVIIGTGLTESIAAAALSKAGYKVAHLDENPYYGGREASLSLDELVEWVDTKASANDPHYSSVQRSQSTLSQSRQYSICLCPAVIPSIGPTISSLVSSGVSKYGGFRLLERVGVYHPTGVVKNVPGTKEDVFKSKDMSLIDKRRLMRFLMFSIGDFENKKELEGNHHLPFADFLKTVFTLNDEVVTALIYSLAYCFSPSDPTGPALDRIRRYLRSAGRYGPSPFLVGHYGGTGDIAQGFCRAAAVSGAVYILGRNLTSIRYNNPQDLISVQHQPGRYSITLQDFPDTLTCNVIISSFTDIPLELRGDINYLAPSTSENLHSSSTVVRCIAIIDRPIYFPPTEVIRGSINESEPFDETTRAPPPAPQIIDAGVLVFPPSTIRGGSTTMAATLLITGEGTMSTPKGKWILYLALPLATILPVSGPMSAQEILQPYLNAALALTLPPDGPAPHVLDTESPPQLTPPQPLFTTFYIHHVDLGNRPHTPSHSHTTLEQSKPGTFIIPSPLSPTCPLPDISDNAATHAETVFWEVTKLLNINEPPNAENDARMNTEIGGFWPTLDTANDSGDEEW